MFQRTEQAASVRRGALLLAVGLLTGAGAVGLGLGVGPSDLRSALTGGDPAPAASPSAGPTPTPSRTPLLPSPTAAPPADAAALGRDAAPLLARLLAAPGAGPRVAVSVRDVASGEHVLAHRPDAAVLPASTAKVLTAAAALLTLEPDARLETTVVRGASPGELVLVAGGDPDLAPAGAPRQVPDRARLDDLVTVLRDVPGVTRLLVDDTAYPGPRTGPGWRPSYVTSGNVAPVTGLAVDGGRPASAPPRRGPRAADPSLDAATRLAQALGVQAPVGRGTAPGAAEVLATVRSAPLVQRVEEALSRSDNDLAEALAREVAVARGEPPTFAGAAAALAAALAELGVTADDAALVDGSGLSRESRLRPAALTRLLAEVARGERPALAPLLAGLSVGGFDGTLGRRYREGEPAAVAGRVRAKSGTLDGVTALAGVVRTASGRVLAFDVTADAVPSGRTLDAELALDTFVAGLAALP